MAHYTYITQREKVYFEVYFSPLFFVENCNPDLINSEWGPIWNAGTLVYGRLKTKQQNVVHRPQAIFLGIEDNLKSVVSRVFQLVQKLDTMFILET